MHTQVLSCFKQATQPPQGGIKEIAFLETRVVDCEGGGGGGEGEGEEEMNVYYLSHTPSSLIRLHLTLPLLSLCIRLHRGTGGPV